jgi:hypothetical protein
MIHAQGKTDGLVHGFNFLRGKDSDQDAAYQGGETHTSEFRPGSRFFLPNLLAVPHVKLARFNRVLLITGHVLPLQGSNPHLF